MKIANRKLRTVSFAQVKKGQTCRVEGLTVIKVRDKMVMTTKGDVVPVANNVLVKIEV